MNVSTSLECLHDYCGPLCERASNCSSCDPGYTGRFCSDFITSPCSEALCNTTTMICVDKRMGHDCVCKSGYTGSDCITDINECAINEDLCFFNGECVNKIGSFYCSCFDGYTGEFCETRIPRYSVDITFHSFTNPGGRCADLSGTCANGTGCCDFRDCRDIHCNYMFLYCLRPSGTSISYLRSENRGYCAFNETRSKKIAVEDDFFSSIYGKSNPIKYTSNQSVIYIPC